MHKCFGEYRKLFTSFFMNTKTSMIFPLQEGLCTTYAKHTSGTLQSLLGIAVCPQCFSEKCFLGIVLQRSCWKQRTAVHSEPYCKVLWEFQCTQHFIVKNIEQEKKVLMGERRWDPQWASISEHLARLRLSSRSWQSKEIERIQRRCLSGLGMLFSN